MAIQARQHVTRLTILAVVACTSGGCLSKQFNSIPSVGNMPKELTKITLPEHMIEPPDVLQIDLVAAIPKPPYRLQALDAISLRVPNALLEAPIQGVYQVDTDGTVNLGSSYGLLNIAGLTVSEAKDKIFDLLKSKIKDPQVEIALGQTRGQQQVRGPHLVRPDGTVWFETYGAVRVVGMTIPQARQAIEEHLSQFFLQPQVAISITGYNSKVFYIIFDGQYNGATQVTRLPVTGNETVIDAVSQVGGMSPIADYDRIWIARPAPEGSCPQILPVDWRAITEKAEVATNYQILPGDRLFVKTNAFVSSAARLDRFFAPIERILGFSLLGLGTFQSFANVNNNGGNFNNGGFGF